MHLHVSLGELRIARLRFVDCGVSAASCSEAGRAQQPRPRRTARGVEFAGARKEDALQRKSVRVLGRRAQPQFYPIFGAGQFSYQFSCRFIPAFIPHGPFSRLGPSRPPQGVLSLVRPLGTNFGQGWLLTAGGFSNDGGHLFAGPVFISVSYQLSYPSFHTPAFIPHFLWWATAPPYPSHGHMSGH